ncbi:MAG: RdgB/HAM1 family non-canonical purine NTP pyrophosphatase [Campylobacterales bacterium]|nr:RdgB/HAM1 family non-canonical purine NTP pyrophosphatase [Campylobacterales bacterium]
MKIVLATSNKGKIREIKAFLEGFDVVGFDELMTPFDIDETGATFKENALIKARAVYAALEEKNAIALSDDSGISVPLLGGEPGIYSARYAGKGAGDKENLTKLVETLRACGVSQTPAFYTAAIALATPWGEFSVHGWMHGHAINETRGTNGFGYDPMFIPEGYTTTLGEMDAQSKRDISHRTQALKHAMTLLNTLKGNQ